MRRTVRIAGGAVIVVCGAIGGLAVGSAFADESSPSRQSAATAPESAEPVYNGDLLVAKGDETVGHIRQSDMTGLKTLEDGEVVQAYYPQIGYSVYNDADVLVGFATERGFIALDDVEQYRADPSKYPLPYVLAPSDENLPPGVEPVPDGSTNDLAG